MPKTKTTFFCQNCGTQHAKWVGQCGACKEWNTIVEEIIQKEEKRVWKQSTTAKQTVNKPLKIADIQLNPEERVITNNNELDTVLGGGLVKGSVTLLGGEPGIGKSTALTKFQQQNDDIVEFTAFYFENKSVFQLHETSRFIKENGVWRYHDGTLHDDCGKVKYGRNLPCLCASNKKFKQCCALKAR